MGCLLPIFAVFLPRVALVIIFLFTDWFHRCFQTLLWPLLGFLFMPYTTLAWMAAMLFNNYQLKGGWIIVLVVAVVMDLGGHGGVVRGRRRL
jgi:hypothetical protein